MIEISVELNEEGKKKSLGKIISEVTSTLGDKYDLQQEGLRLKEFKKQRDALVLKYDLVQYGRGRKIQ